jgi:hypothetical protein
LRTHIFSGWLRVTAGFVFALGFILTFHAKSLSSFFWDEDDMAYASLACSNSVPNYIFSSDSFVQFFPRPATHLYCWLIASVAKTTVWPYFLSNMILLALSAVLVFLLSQKLFDSLYTSFLIALFFLVFPCSADSVYWFAAGATTYLSTVFVLTTALLYLAAGTDKKNRTTLVITAVFSSLLAVGAKEATVVIPLLLTLFEFTGKTPTSGRREKLKRLLPFYCVSAAYTVYVLFVQYSFHDHANIAKYGLDPIILKNLLHFFAYPLAGSLPPVAGRYNTIKVIIYSVLWIAPLLLGSRRTKNLVLFAFAWIIITSLPYLPWRTSSHSLLMEVCDIETRYFHLPSVGAAMVITGFFQMISERLKKKQMIWLAVVFAAAVAFTGVVLVKKKAAPMVCTGERNKKLIDTFLSAWDGEGIFYIGYFGISDNAENSLNRMYFNGNLIVMDAIPQGVPPGTQMMVGPAAAPVLTVFDGYGWPVVETYESCDIIPDNEEHAP